MFRESLRSVLHKCGIDVRLLRNIQKSQRLAWEETWRQQYSAVPLKRIRTIIDIGANTGQFAMMIKKACPDAAIYSFEPVAECYEALKHNLSDMAAAKTFRMALGETKGRVLINKSAFTPSSSILQMGDLHKRDWPQSSEHTTEEVEMTTLDDMFSGRQLEPELLVKIDVQGLEPQVIMGGRATLSKALAVVVETSFYELYKDQVLFDGIYSLMCDLGFSFRGNLDQYVSPIDSRILQADSLFIRKSGIDIGAT
jgi:FkbM family methyltransferase